MNVVGALAILGLTPDEWSVVGSVLSGVGAIASVAVAVILYRGQAALSRQLAQQQATSAASLQQEQLSLTERLHTEQRLFAQRQLLIPLWEHLDGLKGLPPGPAAHPQMVNAANTLELLALLVEGGLLEREVFERAFGSMFRDLCAQLESATAPNATLKSGKQLLREAPAAQRLYKALTHADEERGKLTPFTEGKP